MRIYSYIIDRLTLKTNEKFSKQILIYALGILCLGIAIFFTNHDARFYHKSIAVVTETKVIDKNKSVDSNHNKDIVFSQSIAAKVKNGAYKGKTLHLENTYSSSGAYDQEYVKGTELFVSVDRKSDSTLSGTIKGVKRDTQMVTIVGLFILTLLAIGKKQGFYSVISLVINIILLIGALNVYVLYNHVSLLAISSIAVVIFTIVSLLLVSGKQEKTYVSIISTLLGTFLSLLIAFVVIHLTDANGLRYEGMEFLTILPQKIFMSQILIGSLGAVMDIAITITSALYELYEKNKTITYRELIKSGKEIGGDIMGAMTNILFFSYISGTIPMILLFFEEWFSSRLYIFYEHFIGINPSPYRKYRYRFNDSHYSLPFSSFYL